jgi:hypothetical protein
MLMCNEVCNAERISFSIRITLLPDSQNNSAVVDVRFHCARLALIRFDSVVLERPYNLGKIGFLEKVTSLGVGNGASYVIETDLRIF